MTDKELTPLQRILKRTVADLSQENMPTSSRANYSPPIYDDEACPVCGGYGVISYEVPLDDPRFGKPFPCPRCGEDTRRETRRLTLRKMSNLGAFQEKTFATFRLDLDTINEAQQRSLKWAREECLEYAAAPEGWLLLQGDYGCGKTHLAAAIANRCVDEGIGTLFITTPDLLDHLRGTFGPSSEVPYDELFDRVRNVALLVLDDLGAESPTPWAMEKLYQVINHRHSNRLPMVITTNANLDLLDERIRSRLVDVELTHSLKISAPDYRRGGIVQVENKLVDLTLYADMRFDNWNPRGQELVARDRENLQVAYEISRRFAENPTGWLILTGTYGCGKTHLAAAIANHQHLIGLESMFVTAPDLLDHLRATFSPDSRVSYDRLFNEIRHTPLLILDDLGVENASPWAREKLFQLIDHRYRSRAATVITMSRPLDEIDERLASRMGDTSRGTVVGITAPGYRGSQTPDTQQNSQRRRSSRKR